MLYDFDVQILEYWKDKYKVPIKALGKIANVWDQERILFLSKFNLRMGPWILPLLLFITSLMLIGWSAIPFVTYTILGKLVFMITVLKFVVCDPIVDLCTLGDLQNIADDEKETMSLLSRLVLGSVARRSYRATYFAHFLYIWYLVSLVLIGYRWLAICLLAVLVLRFFILIRSIQLLFLSPYRLFYSACVDD